MVSFDTACLSAETYPLALVTITSPTVGEIMFLTVGLILANAEGDQCQLTFMGLRAIQLTTHLPPTQSQSRASSLVQKASSGQRSGRDVQIESSARAGALALALECRIFNVRL